MILMFMMMFFLLLSLILMLINYFFSKTYLNEKEKSSPFECGFDPFSSSRMPFSIQFFMISMIFLIFDIELVILLPFLPSFEMTEINWNEIFSWFIMIMILGVFTEWWDGALTWMK